MKDLKLNNELLGYAAAFISYAIPKLKNIEEIFLFGSVARKEADENSDIDLFFNVSLESYEKFVEKEVLNILNEFYKSKISEIWKLKGISNKINIKVGILDKWGLKRSIISEGIVLYGPYKESPKNLSAYAYINIHPIENIAKRNKIIRYLFGRKEKTYEKQGNFGIKRNFRQTSLSFFVSLEKVKEILYFLNKEKVPYKIIEVWSDQLA